MIAALTSSIVKDFCVIGSFGYEVSSFFSTNGPKSPNLSYLLTIKIPFFFSGRGATTGVSIAGATSTSFCSLASFAASFLQILYNPVKKIPKIEMPNTAMTAAKTTK